MIRVKVYMDLKITGFLMGVNLGTCHFCIKHLFVLPNFYEK